MEFRLLGPFEVEHEGRPLAVGRRRERCLLAVLLLEANTAVSVEQLAELLWHDAPPRDPRSTIHTYVSRLRGLLDADGQGRRGVRLTRSGQGYLATVDPGTVDALRFRSLVNQARGLVDPAERAALLRQALRLWRGPMLADVDFEHLQDRLAAPWQEARLAATEAAIDAELACARHHEIIGELRALTSEHPYRERLTALLMIALYRAGRQAEALEAYQRARRTLVDHLGIEPGPELRRLHERVLAGDTDLLAPAAGGQVAQPAAAVPRQLPAAPRHFTGRRAEMDALTGLLEETSATGGTVVISAIDGMAGIGKTALQYFRECI
jgi:DNA-binding SARP family transcriptional activator